MWSEVGAKSTERSAAAPGPRVFLMNSAAFDSVLRLAPMEFQNAPAAVTIALPMPGGEIQRFAVEESPIMQPELASRYPTIKTYSLRGIDDPTISGRLDRNANEMHALLLTHSAAVEIDPAPGRSHPYYRSDYDRTRAADIECGAGDIDFASIRPELYKSTGDAREAKSGPVTRNAPSGGTLRTYRLAVATTGEYYAGRGGTDASVLASIVTVINRVNAIYESEIAIRLILIGNTDDLFFTDPNTDGYSNNNPCTMRNENTPIIDGVIGAGAYDIGHVFGTSPGGGCAGGAVVCGAQKGNGASGLNVGAPADQESFSGYRLVAHEAGHQLGAAHTWSGANGNCTPGQFAAASSYEPLGGTTLMAYSGTCGVDNIQGTAADTYFHTHSFDQIVAFSTGGGNACAGSIATGNSIPVVNAGPDYTIPQGTPFTLTGSATDANDANLSYAWEQYDLAGQQISPLTDLGFNPLFRSFPPVLNNPSRTFPQMSDILNNTTTQGELLPTTNRTMNFRLTARDNRAAGGGVDYDAMQVTVNGAPFRILSPNGGETLNAGCTIPVTWQVGGGAVATNVDLLYSSNGGSSFSNLLLNTANDGSQNVTISCSATNSGRIRANAVGNIFFDISDADFKIQSNAPTVSVQAQGGAVDNSCQYTVPFSATITDDCSVNAANVSVQVTELTGNANLGTPTINKVQQNATTVTVSGSVTVSALTNSPATVRVSVTATDGCGVQTSKSADANVVDNTPPTISATLTPDVIWAPTHKMIDIAANVNVQDNCPVTSFQLVSVTSSEPDDTTGDGAFINDIQGVSAGTADTSFKVRAERAMNGPGRVYEATYKASDGSGNEATAKPTVTVPKDQSN